MFRTFRHPVSAPVPVREQLPQPPLPPPSSAAPSQANLLAMSSPEPTWMRSCRPHLDCVAAAADGVLAASDDFERAVSAILVLDAALTSAAKAAGEVTMSHFVMATLEQERGFAIYSGRVLSYMSRSHSHAILALMHAAMDDGPAPDASWSQQLATLGLNTSSCIDAASSIAAFESVSCAIEENRRNCVRTPQLQSLSSGPGAPSAARNHCKA